MKMWKRSLSILLVLAMIITSLPIIALPVFAEGSGNVTKYDNPWDYTVFGNSITIPVNVMGSSVNIDGDLHANKGINCLGNEITISGSAEAGGNVVLGDIQTDFKPGEDIEVGEVVENAKSIELPQIYYSIMALEGNKARSEITEDTAPEDLLRTSIISDEDINIDLTGSYPEDMQRYTKKAGAFGAGFLTKVYENQDKWADVLPAFDKTYLSSEKNEKTDLVELVDNSFFAAVQEQAIDEAKYVNWDKLPDTTFMNNLNNAGYVSGYIDKVLSDIPGSSSEYETLAEGGVNPSDAQGKGKLYIPNNINVTLQGDYNDLEELYIDSYNGIQLLGNFPKLKHVYASSGCPNLNLAGDFASLEGVYQTQGTMLLGTSDLGFNAVDADIINSDGTITLYMAKDINISGCQILNKTNGIAIRGGGVNKTASKFIVDGALIASNHSVTLVDINDNNTTRFSEVPAIFSQASLSIVNCNFKLLQGAFVTRNDAMKFANSNADVFSGFLFAQNGIDEWDFSGSYVECGTYNYLVQPNINTPDVNLNGDKLGHIGKIEYAQLPEKLTVVPGMEDMLSQSIQMKNSDGEYVDYYEYGLREDEENIIYIMSKGNITITADDFSTPKGRRMILVSRNGDIKINDKNTTADDGTYDTTIFDGIIYAQKGNVEIRSEEGFIQYGRIYSDITSLSGRCVDIYPQDDDLDVINVSEQFKLDDSKYEYEKAYNTYYLDNSALNDSIMGSLHTSGEVENISYKVQKLNYFTQGWHEPYIEGEIDAQSRYFTINNAVLRIGLNKITFTAELKSGKIINNEFNVIFFDEDNLDTNDNDNDKLLNWQEEFYDTDKNNIDTDGDTLSDYIEIYELELNPLVIDTDGNGVTDDNEDFDLDGLTNGQEFNGVSVGGNLYKSDPTMTDTDGDTIDDYTEVYVYGTDPSKKDTDGDGVDDNVEIEIDSDPLTAELSFTRTVSKKSTAKKVTASATLDNVSGKAVNTLSVEEVEDDPFLNSNIQGYIDSAFEFSTDDGIEKARISFTMDNMPSSARIYYVNEKKHILEKLSAEPVGNTITAEVEHFSKYILIDEEDYNSAFTEIPLYTESRKQPLDVVVAVNRALTDPEELRYDIYKNIAGKLDANENDRIALVFGDGIYNGVYYSQAFRTFNDSLNSSLIPSKDIFGLNSQDYVDDKSYAMSLLKEGLYLFPAKGESGYRENSKKILVVMDSGIDERFGGGIDGSALVEAAKDDNIYIDEIIAIGFEDVNSKLDLSGLQTFADKCYIAEDYVSEGYLGFKPEVTKNPIDFDSKINSGGIGIYNDDIAEMLRNGTIRDIYGNKVFGENASLDKCKATADFDGDGLENYKEINIIRSGNTFMVWYSSMPTMEDTDWDGINDKDDKNTLVADTIEELFHFDLEYSKKNPVNIDVDKNTIYVTAYVMFDGDVGEIYPGSDMTYEEIIENSIEQYWTKEFCGSEYDFLPTINGKIITDVKVGNKSVGSDGQHYFKITIDAHDITDEERALYELKKFEQNPVTSWSGWQWSWEVKREIYMPRCDVREEYPKTAEQYGNSVSHEFGHVLGLADAYPKANHERKFVNTSEISRGNDDIHLSSNIMNENYGNRIVYANDIEMVLESYATNEFQYYYDLPYEGKDMPATTRSRVIRLTQQEDFS